MDVNDIEILTINEMPVIELIGDKMNYLAIR